jgi:hypothetical protein
MASLIVGFMCSTLPPLGCALLVRMTLENALRESTLAGCELSCVRKGTGRGAGVKATACLGLQAGLSSTVLLLRCWQQMNCNHLRLG